LSIATSLKNSTAVAIGGFDGMHIGHQALFRELGKNGCIVVIETGYANLTPKGNRKDYTNYPILHIQLDTIRHLDAKGFVDLLKKRFEKLQKIVVGYDFHFGKDRKYSYDDLKSLFYGEVVVVPVVKYDGIPVHSRKIREKLQIGDIKSANAFLGHYYSIKGTLEKGQGIGSKELVATINIATEGFLIPKNGVYVTLTRIDNEKQEYLSVSFIGNRISTDEKFSIETHIIDNKVICKKNATISFLSFIRENRKFDNLKELKKEIQNDILVAKEYLILNP